MTNHSIGYALAVGDGPPLPSTVASTERAAMVNALVAVYGRMVMASHSDAQIKRDFELHKSYGHSIVPVTISRLPVPPVES
jgi:hypothetical protein